MNLSTSLQAAFKRVFQAVVDAIDNSPAKKFPEYPSDYDSDSRERIDFGLAKLKADRNIKK